jgi:hypothetical protein
MQGNVTGRKSLSITEAGRIYFGLGKNSSYAAAKRGDIPTIQIGGKKVVPVVALERMLAEAGKQSTQIDKR